MDANMGAVLSISSYISNVEALLVSGLYWGRQETSVELAEEDVV